MASAWLSVSRQASLWRMAQSSSPDVWLSPSEKERLATMSLESRREEFIACRYALRRLLARADGQISDWQLGAPLGQSPQLIGSPPGVTVHLSLSHSHGWIVCAAAPEPVGIDVEVLARESASSLDELALLACTSAERNELASLADEAERRVRFMQWWSLKEAFFKQLGTGIDFSMLPRVACVREQDVLAANAMNGSQSAATLAHARGWTACTPDGHVALLSLCTRLDVQTEIDSDDTMDWQDAGRFTLRQLCATGG